MEAYTAIVAEIRADFQIPPYYSDAVIQRAVEECETRLAALNPYADFENDKEGRTLLKNYVYYAMNHKLEEFERNYQTLIKSWQLGAAYAEES